MMNAIREWEGIGASSSSGTNTTSPVNGLPMGELSRHVVQASYATTNTKTHNYHSIYSIDNMRPELQKKVNFAIMLIQESSKANKNEPIEVAYSGGKDSDVILELTKMAGIPYRAIYKNTTIDPPGTIKHAQEMGAEMLRPEKTFLKLIEERGLPTRSRRFCCQYLKEYKVLDKQIQGIRKAESAKRDKRYNAPTACRYYGSKKNHVEVIYPILGWSDQDISEFIAERGIKCHPLYYDESGNFHVERRLGCLGCPQAYYTKRIADFRKYPKLYIQIVRRLRKYRQNHPHIQNCIDFADEYEQLYFDLMCKDMEEFKMVSGGMFGKPDFKKYLEDKFNIKL